MNKWKNERNKIEYKYRWQSTENSLFSDKSHYLFSHYDL